MRRGAWGPIRFAVFFPVLLMALSIAFPPGAIAKKKTRRGFEEMLQIFAEQPTVSAGSKIPVPENQAPYSVSVIDEKDIQEYQPLGLTDLLSRVQGVDLLPLNDSMSFMNIRGILDASAHQARTLFLIDGVPTWVNTAGINLMNSLPVSLDDIEQIEVIRTPTTISGANAVEGLISITTKNPRKDTGIRFRGGVGSQGTWKTYLGYGDSLGAFSYRVSLSEYQSDVWRPAFFDQPNLIPNPPNPYSKRFKVSARLNYTKGNEEWNLDFGRSDENGLFSGAAPFSVLFNTPHDFLAATYTDHLGKDSRLTFRISHDKVSTGFTTEYFGKPVSGFFEEGRDELGFEHYFPWAGSQIFSWGGQFYHYDVGSSQDPTPPFVIPVQKPLLGFVSMNLHRSGWGIYFQNKSALTGDDALYYGGRYDHDWTGETGFAPFISFVHLFNPGVSLRANVNTAFRFPDVTELFGNLTPAILNPAGSPLPFVLDFYGSEFANGVMVKPERVTDYELAYGGLFSKRVSAHLELYYKDVNNYIDRHAFEVSPLTCFTSPAVCAQYPPFAEQRGFPAFPVEETIGFPRNFPHVEIAGVELSTDVRLDSHFTAYGNYRNQTANQQLLPAQAAQLGIPENEKLRSSPQVIATLGIKYAGSGWSGFLEGQTYTERSLEDFGRTTVIPGNTVANIGFTVPFVERTKLSFVGYDIFNSPEQDLLSGLNIGGRFQMSLSYGF